jgi:hypothetical protein
MNEDDLNAMEPLGWYRRARPWLLLFGLPALVLLLLRVL